MDQRTCNQCGVHFTPQHPLNKFCEKHRGKRASRLRDYSDCTCSQCGTTFRASRATAKLCSDSCRSLWYSTAGIQPVKKGRNAAQICKLPVDHPVRAYGREASRLAARGPLRSAIEDGDFPALCDELWKRTDRDGECWIWRGQTDSGYPIVSFSGQSVRIHRVVIEVEYGRPLGKQAAHHKCGKSRCVNPDHLQPVTARENTAEMLARTYLEARISDLESALRTLDPSHPLLAEIGALSAA